MQSDRPASDAPFDLETITAGVSLKLEDHRERAQILGAVLEAVSQSEAVRALIADSESDGEARGALKQMLGIDDRQALAVLNLQMRRLTAKGRQLLADELEAHITEIAELELILESPERLRRLVGTERGDSFGKLAVAVARNRDESG